MKEPLLHETKIHGTKDFPYIVYHGIIPDFFKAYPLHWHDEVEIIYSKSTKAVYKSTEEKTQSVASLMKEFAHIDD